MKTLILVLNLSLFSFVSNTSTLESIVFKKTTITTTIATFDGAEGNYFFFTDINSKKAVQFESIDDQILNDFNLIEGDNIGDVFNISYEDTKIVALKPIITANSAISNN